MKKAYVFPGQGAQFSGMGKDLYDNVPQAKELFDKANEILGFDITEIMFNGTAEELKQTKVTQPAVFLPLGDSRTVARHRAGCDGRTLARRVLGSRSGRRTVVRGRSATDCQTRRSDAEGL